MMRTLLLAILAALVFACGGEETASKSEPPATSPPVEPAPAPTPAPPVAQAECLVPAGELVGDAEAGKSQYQIYCTTCHGAKGKGDGPAAPKDPKPADHSNAAYMDALSDAHLYKVIACGGPAVDKSPLMAKWGGILNEQQIKDLIAYVRTLSKS